MEAALEYHLTMHEPEFFNNTSFLAAPFPLIDAEGFDCRVVIVKATYKLNENSELADKSSPIRAGDEMWGPPEIPDIKYPGDLCSYKPGTDILLVGHAEADSSNPSRPLTINIKVGSIHRQLRVYGDRLWDTWALGLTMTPPAPLERVPLAWSRAWGGFDDSDPQFPVEEPRNPVGRGVARRPKDLAGKPAPQIEDPAAPIAPAASRNTPVGCAPLGRHFEPRRAWAGTYDGNWLQNVYPAKPADYDARHENCAPPELALSNPIAPGEYASITGLKPRQELRFVVPAVRLTIDAIIDGEQTRQTPHLDTVLIDADAGVVELVWRAAFRCPFKMRNRFNEIQVSSKRVI